MGFLVSFLSKPLIKGFTSGAAIIIGLSQIKHMLGISLHQSNKIQLFAISLVNSEISIHFPTLMIGVISIFILLILKKWTPKIPSALVVVILSSLWVYLGNNIKRVLRSLAWFRVDFHHLILLILILKLLKI